MNFTDEQMEIFGDVTDETSNLMINALAGTGKTSTLEHIDKITKQKPVLYLVFNKRNADEATERMLATTTVRTFNGLGHRIWQSAVSPRLRLDTKKIYLIFKEFADELRGEAAREVWDSYEQVKFGVEIARALGYIPEDHASAAKSLISRNVLHNHLEEEPDDLVADLIDGVLKRSIKLAYDGVIDYNDQVYMSALFGGLYPQFPLTLVDEYQDLNPVNHEMIRKLVKKRRLIGVGDPQQNIYGFRGAKVNGMHDAIHTFSMVEHDLSISFRCPEAIVRNARWHVPHFKWFRTGGTVGNRDYLNPDTLEDNAVILCRLNAPLFALAFKLIASGRSIDLVGTDVGPRLVKTLSKLGDPSLTQAQTLSAIEEWREVKLAKGHKTANDMANCMRIIASHGSSLGTAISYAEHLFRQRGAIRLMTGHKAKGLEFPLVYHLDPHVIGDGPQDRNLRYVIQTRSSSEYYEVASDTIKWGLDVEVQD